MRLATIAIVFGATLVTLGPALAGPGTPGTGGLVLAQGAETSPVIEVRNHAGAFIGGLIIGGLLGGAIASQGGMYSPVYPYPYYRPYPMYPVDPAVGYCMGRFRSYDPYSMTYLGYDGRRHPCP